MGITEEEKTDLVEYRLQRAKDVLVEAKDVYMLNHYILAVNRLYYAIFYALSALLIKDGHSAITHAGIRSLMGKHYVITGVLTREEGKLFSDLFNMRHTGDYGDSFDISKNEVEEYIGPSTQLVEKIISLVKCNSM